MDIPALYPLSDSGHALLTSQNTTIMSFGSQVKSVDPLSPSDEELERVACELVSKGVVIEKSVSHPKSFTTADKSVCAVLVHRRGAEGAVRVTGPGTPHPIPNVITGPSENGWDIIAVKEGQTCMFFGNPTVRFFKVKQE
ncbi:uncharacterized protein BO80DRAFT_120230 [Aspergillus ibericus CBS 121593]|uniref:Uncharacterized protein n=1 Tax=Aspergillus ibericus CBS 121593 TaxID=1448316 RepID=A0A395GX75_9EURO|nr:hypothetical protein BO80DRAFT_120230 [Aspergillus ibericus CBS 121593]RAK99638.1 hypothetical protein BO80DRAFT_120230 [Aspergillus ibericus CBS 121593]